MFYFFFSLWSKLFSTCFAHKSFYNQCIQSFLVFWYHSNELKGSKLQTFFVYFHSITFNGSVITRQFLSFLCLYLIILLIVLFHFVYHVFECGGKRIGRKLKLFCWSGATKPFQIHLGVVAIYNQIYVRLITLIINLSILNWFLSMYSV